MRTWYFPFLCSSIARSALPSWVKMWEHSEERERERENSQPTNPSSSSSPFPVLLQMAQKSAVASELWWEKQQQASECRECPSPLPSPQNPVSSLQKNLFLIPSPKEFQLTFFQRRPNSLGSESGRGWFQRKRGRESESPPPSPSLDLYVPVSDHCMGNRPHVDRKRKNIQRSTRTNLDWTASPVFPKIWKVGVVSLSNFSGRAEERGVGGGEDWQQQKQKVGLQRFHTALWKKNIPYCWQIGCAVLYLLRNKCAIRCHQARMLLWGAVAFSLFLSRYNKV